MQGVTCEVVATQKGGFRVETAHRLLYEWGTNFR